MSTFGCLGSINLKTINNERPIFPYNSFPAYSSYLSIFLSPIEIIRTSSSSVFVDQLLNHVPRVVQLVQIVFKHLLLPELLQKGLSLAQFVVLVHGTLEQLQPTLERDSRLSQVYSPRKCWCGWQASDQTLCECWANTGNV